jgi:urea transport system substrate-binding protein
MTDSHDGSHDATALTEWRATRRSLVKAAAAATFGLPFLASGARGGLRWADRSSAGSIKIGGLFHKTGIGQIWGDIQARPAILAVEEINKAGGVLGKKLVLISEDDQTNPDVSVRKGSKLALQDRVEAIFGLVYSSTRSAVAANVAARYKVPYFYPTYSEGGVCGRYFVNVGALPNQQLDFFIPYLMRRFGKGFYFVGQDYVWPRESIKYCQRLIARNGGKVLGAEYVPIGKTRDWAPILGRIQKKKPDVYFPFIGGDDLIANLRQFFDFGLNNEVGLASTLLDESFVPALPKKVRGGIPCAASYFMANNTPENKAFLRRFRARFGTKAIVTNIGEGVYDSIWLWKLAVEKAGKIDKEAMIDALPKVKFKAPQGEIYIYKNTNHAALHQIIAESRPDGTFRLIKDFGLVKPISHCKI